MSELAKILLPGGLDTVKGACNGLCALLWFTAFAGLFSWLVSSLVPLYVLGMGGLLLISLIYACSLVNAVNPPRRVAVVQGQAVANPSFAAKKPGGTRADRHEVPPLLLASQDAEV